MSQDAFTEKPSGTMPGKEFLIVLVIIFSGLSFTLGYFVGKSGAPEQAQALPAIETGQVQKQQLQQPPAAAQEQVQTAAAQPAVMLPIREQASAITPAAEKVATQKNPEQLVKPVPEKASQKIEPAEAAESKSTVYTVQLGAFKSMTEAKHLKVKFDKKGYKSFISTGKDRNTQKIYKVKTGEFREKKEAEVLALKLKKTEGLQTYVTLKTE